MKAKAIPFGAVVTHIPTAWDADGNVTGYSSIIDQYQSIRLEDVQREAHRRYGNELTFDQPIPLATNSTLWTQRAIDPANNNADKPTFFNRVNGTVVAESLNNTMSAGALRNLQLKKHQFSFIGNDGDIVQDGPTMLYLLLCKGDPSTTVSNDNHRTAIENAKLQAYKNEVPELIAAIENHHTAIIENGGTYDKETFRRHVINALLSGPNAEFNKFIGDVKREVQAGIGQYSEIDVPTLFKASERLYNNLVSTDSWDKVDPKDARIMALATEVEKLKKESKDAPDKKFTPKSDNHDTTRIAGIEKWRTINVGATTTHNGTQWSWCPHHKHPQGLYSGLYYKDHNETSHEEWKKARKARDAAQKKTDSATDDKTQGAGKKKMVISDELKTAFVTDLCVSEEDIQKILDRVNSSSAQGN